MGVLIDQDLRGFGQRPPRILFGIPGLGADVIQESLPFLIVGNQFAVEVMRAPTEENTAEIKNYCTNRHQILRWLGLIAGGVWQI